jgi:hypothetical protein
MGKSVFYLKDLNIKGKTSYPGNLIPKPILKMLLVANVSFSNFRKLGPKCNVAIENCVSYCAKAIGEETYFVGDKQELVTIILFHCFQPLSL